MVCAAKCDDFGGISNFVQCVPKKSEQFFSLNMVIISTAALKMSKIYFLLDVMLIFLTDFW